MRHQLVEFGNISVGLAKAQIKALARSEMAFMLREHQTLCGLERHLLQLVVIEAPDNDVSRQQDLPSSAQAMESGRAATIQLTGYRHGTKPISPWNGLLSLQVSLAA